MKVYSNPASETDGHPDGRDRAQGDDVLLVLCALTKWTMTGKKGGV